MGGAITGTNVEEKDVEVDDRWNVEEVVVTQRTYKREEECRGQYENDLGNWDCDELTKGNRLVS